jgi:pilus assembly protein FimV
MGDSDGARAMLEEVMAEGSQMQKDTARRILADIG